MNAVSENKYRLVVTHDSARLALVCGGLGVAGLILAAWRWSQFSGPSEYFWGAIGAAVTLLLIASVCFERSCFVVDAKQHLITWQRRRLLGAQRGELTFSEVRGVVSERPIGEDRFMRRVVLHTMNDDVPVTRAYLSDPHDVALGLALKIRVMIGLGGVDATVPEEVKQLVAGGRTVEAMRTLRKTQGVSLREAQDTIRRL